MRTIKPYLTEELLKHCKNDRSKVAATDAYPVCSYRELLRTAARLAYCNKDYLLFYRGQNKDYRNSSGKSTFYPSIYRGTSSASELQNKFDLLENAGKELVKLFKSKQINGYKDVKNRKLIRWSILQHYEVCGTPLLDFTQSLRVACSFAMMDSADTAEKYAYVYMFGFPYLTNRISINSEHDLINIRLLSICPPDALRPYSQEGYLAGTDEITCEYDRKDTLDFNNRLIAKFRIPTSDDFWEGSGVHKIGREFLYPENDPIQEICSLLIPSYLGGSGKLNPASLGLFLQYWQRLEHYLTTNAGIVARSEQVISPAQAIRILKGADKLPSNGVKIEILRRIRNTIVHRTPKHLTENDLAIHIGELKSILQELNIPAAD